MIGEKVDTVRNRKENIEIDFFMIGEKWIQFGIEKRI